MGEKVVEDLQLLHGSYRVEGVLLTGPTRLDLALGLASAFQLGRIRIPPRDPKLRADLMAIKRVGSEESGSVRIVNDGTIHADRFWAASLMIRALSTGPQEISYRSVPKPTLFTDRPDAFGDSMEAVSPFARSNSFHTRRDW